MSQFADCYVLTNNRTKEFIYRFLDTFLPNRKEQTDVYEVPYHGKHTEIEFNRADDLIDYLVANVNTPHTIYWQSTGEESMPRFANCFFTEDNNLIVGISGYADGQEDESLTTLMDFCGIRLGYIAYEEPAPHSTREFMDIVRNLETR